MQSPITNRDIVIISGQLRLVPESIVVGAGIIEMQLKYFCQRCDEWHYLHRVDTKLQTLRRGWDYVDPQVKADHP